ncbi:PstS family phosphate ABC transporter substrate-binding protein [Gloeobacter kilaueensis]|uniref:Phosphate binding protein n=1 Tax=Gloeobacter kilaueensis (strain ATCC BAA-2537 / CCAP 1431/1 / ULC 316 / JS1) TaxID=1183438 RepID=U5QRT8_GLOK1|nr:PstS family phosphate ABC transporter substrate-binding protein [Gloeobacter kilaueensis]AGY60405.1 phosphate binding protein [Gloeobacter kilaueensis JS1]
MNRQQLLTAVVSVALLAAGLLVFSSLRPPEQSSIGAIAPGLAETPLQSTGLIRQVPDVPIGLFKYGGSTAFARLRSLHFTEEIARRHPDFLLLYTEPEPNRQPGTGSGMAMLIEGKLAIAQTSRPVRADEREAAKRRGFELGQIAVARDGVAFYVHPGLPLKQLSLKQLKAIYTGQVRNWQQLGGPALAITPFSMDTRDSGTAEFVQKAVLGGAPFAPSVRQARDTTTSIRLVSATAGAIGYASSATVLQQKTVRALALTPDANGPYLSPFTGNDQARIDREAIKSGRYPLAHQLYIVFREDGTDAQKAAIAYAKMLLTDEGQRFVEQAGLVSLH